jgi:predicted phage terminase large subunit-like protein
VKTLPDLNREQAIEILKEKPYLFGHEVGFTKLEKLHNQWIKEMVLGNEDETLQAHRGSYKTTCDSIAFAIIIILFPNEKTLFLRKTDNDVKEIIKQTIKILEHPLTIELVRAIWGISLAFTRRSATEINTNLTNDPRGTSQFVGMGIGGSLTGKHFDRIFTDDIVNIEDRTSRAERERTKLMYQELSGNILNRGGRIFNTGTPWHKEDCFTLMPNIKKYDYTVTGLISEQEIAEIKDSMLPSLFAANYELRHIASEDIIFANPVTGGDPSKVQQSNYCHIDAAYEGSDYTAFTICRKTEGKYYVFGKLWRKHIDDCEKEIIAIRKQFNAGKIYNETNADKGYLAKQLRKHGERVVEYWESMNKFLKIVTYLKGEWKNIVFVSGTDQEYIDQITDFNENAEHDDAPDSLSSIIRELWGRRGEDERQKRIPDLY